jgi:leucyl aminopeptidase (aminopeptidase T)
VTTGTESAPAPDPPSGDELSPDELVALVRTVFAPRPQDRRIAVITDLPDDRVPDRADWRLRRVLAQSWAAALDRGARQLGLAGADLFLYRHVGTNNGELPPAAWRHEGGELPADADAAAAAAATGAVVPFEDVFADHGILLAPTRYSTTAPLKNAARRFGFRAATMPGFSPAMVPALRLDYGEVDRRCRALAVLVDAAEEAVLRFRVEDAEHVLRLDLRHRTAHVSGGLLREPGTAGNLPSGETYVVPWEGTAGDPSRSHGELPVELEGEVVVYRIVANRAREVAGDGLVARRERELLVAEPAYGNLAELGLGVLAELGVEPIGEVLLDEKLGLHVAFGRSDHFGGAVGPADFSRPEAVVHIDRVYLEATQPRVAVVAVDLVDAAGGSRPLMRDGRYVVALAAG